MTLAIMGPLGLFIAWRVLTLGLSDLFTPSDPDRALYWRSSNPEALMEAADRAVQNLSMADAKALSLRLLANSPLDGRALRNLGIVVASQGDKATAMRLYEKARLRAPRDSDTRMKLIETALEQGKIADALQQIDSLLRMKPDLAPVLLPSLSAAANGPGVLEPLGRMLESRPPWRIYFLAATAQSGADPNVVDRVFAARGSDDPIPAQPPRLDIKYSNPDAGEPSGYTEADLLIARQVRDGRWASAYVTWVGTLPQAQRVALGNVFDGNFAFPAVSPKAGWLRVGKTFGWQLPDQGTGFDVRIGPLAQLAGENVLQVAFDGLPLDYHPVKQLLLLGPGHYRLTGMGESEGVPSEDALRWVVACADDDQKPIGQSNPYTGDIPWTQLKAEFDVRPDTGCGVQWLRLDMETGMYKGQPVKGNAVFGHLEIERLGDPQPAEENLDDSPTDDPVLNRLLRRAAPAH